MVNASGYLCCDCEYEKCIHFEDEVVMNDEVKQYLSVTCAIYILRIGQKCKREDCHIRAMMKRKRFLKPSDALGFMTQCYHFAYERSYLDFCLEGNIFENALRHLIRYFNFINCQNDTMAQRFKVLNTNNRYVKGIETQQSSA